MLKEFAGAFVVGPQSSSHDELLFVAEETVPLASFNASD